MLTGLDLEELDSVPAITCAVRAADFRIVFVNAAWRAFARDNGATEAWGEGHSLLDGISRPLRAFYRYHLQAVLATGEPWEHDYDCSSPDTYRNYRLRVLAIAEGAGLLLTHAMRFERPYPDADPMLEADERQRRYQDEHGLVRQCCHCRKVRRVTASESWDWVPAFVAQPPSKISHGLCPLCAVYYYGPGALGDESQPWAPDEPRPERE